MQYRQFAALALATAFALACGTALAQDFPSKPVRMVTQEAGGGNDNIARVLAAGISSGLGQQVIVDNRGGSGGVIATEAVTKAVPDGYTVLSLGSTMWVLPLMQSVPYEPLRDLAPISLTVNSANALILHPDLPVRNVRELIAYAKARPGQLSYAMGGTGSAGHLAAELFKSMAGVDITKVAYKGGTTQMTDLIAGRVHLSFAALATSMPHINSGKLRALAVTSAKPSELMPNLQPIAAEGLPGYEQSVTFGILAPVKTPAAVIARLNRETVQALRTPAMKERLLKVGAEPVGSSPQEFTAHIRSDQERLGKLIRDLGIRHN